MSSSSQVPPRKSNGRRKVTMVKMENESNLQVTFSKRRVGLFKKASELCTLCGTKAAILVFSPANKMYCFGHPNVEGITNKFLDGIPPQPMVNGLNEMIMEAHRNSTVRELNLELIQVESMLMGEKKVGEEVDKIKKTGPMSQSFSTSFDGLNYSQLCVLKETMLDLKKNVNNEAQKGFYPSSSLAPCDSSMMRYKNLHEGFRTFPYGDVGSNMHGVVPSYNVGSSSIGLGQLSLYGNKEIDFSNSVPPFAPLGTDTSVPIPGSIGCGNSGVNAPNDHLNIVDDLSALVSNHRTGASGSNVDDFCELRAIVSGAMVSHGHSTSTQGTSAATNMLPYGTTAINNADNLGFQGFNNGYDHSGFFQNF